MENQGGYITRWQIYSNHDANVLSLQKGWQILTLNFNQLTKVRPQMGIHTIICQDIREVYLSIIQTVLSRTKKLHPNKHSYSQRWKDEMTQTNFLKSLVHSWLYMRDILQLTWIHYLLLVFSFFTNTFLPVSDFYSLHLILPQRQGDY